MGNMSNAAMRLLAVLTVVGYVLALLGIFEVLDLDLFISMMGVGIFMLVVASLTGVEFFVENKTKLVDFAQPYNLFKLVIFGVMVTFGVVLLLNGNIMLTGWLKTASIVSLVVGGLMLIIDLFIKDM